MEKLALDNVDVIVGGKDCGVDYDWSNSGNTWYCKGYKYCRNKHGKLSEVEYLPGTFPSSYCGPKPVKPPYQGGLRK